uniref:Uncharacterized protein n=1 Tax=Anguilla anguilla TaxID=7936 RepID=A0A0E9RIX9_ANGAN
MTQKNLKTPFTAFKSGINLPLYARSLRIKKSAKNNITVNCSTAVTSYSTSHHFIFPKSKKCDNYKATADWMSVLQINGASLRCHKFTWTVPWQHL